MKMVCLTVSVLSFYAIASPLPQVDDEKGRAFSKKTAETTAELARDILSSISSVITKTGELVESINDEAFGNPDITGHIESVKELISVEVGVLIILIRALKGQ